MGLIELYSIDVLNQFVFTECISFGIYSFSSNVFFTKFRRNAFGLDSIITKPLPTSVAVTRRSKKKTKVWKISTPNEKKNGTNPSSPPPPTHPFAHPPKKKDVCGENLVALFHFWHLPGVVNGTKRSKKKNEKGKGVCHSVVLRFDWWFYWVPMRFFSELEWVWLGFVGMNKIRMGFTGFKWVLLNVPKLCQVLLVFQRFHWVLLGFIGFHGFFTRYYWVSWKSTIWIAFTGLDWVLLNFIEFYRVWLFSLRLYQVLLGFVGF